MPFLGSLPCSGEGVWETSYIYEPCHRHEVKQILGDGVRQEAWHGALHGVAMSWTCLGDWTIIFIWILMWIEVSIIVFCFSVLGLFHFCDIFPLSVSASIFSLFLFINMGLTAICFEVIFCLILLRIYLGNIHI